MAAASEPPPSPTKPSSAPSHPPYEQMIIKAIVDLNDKKGSSRKAIAKYIDSTFTSLPHSHAALLAHHLRRLKKKGVVQMVKHSYKLPKKPPNSDGALKRGRGRPPKAKPESAVPGLGAMAKKGPGRPRKPKPSIAVPGLAAVSKRGPGRPRKDPNAVKKVSVSRPKKKSLPTGTGVPRPRGRPPKKLKLDGGQSGSITGVADEVNEVETTTGPVPIIVPVATTEEAASPRPRGRPKKEKSANGRESAAVGEKAKKQRGRPKRDNGAPPSTSEKRPASLEKRPRGRPKKLPVPV